MIDQRLSQLRALIPRFKGHSTAAENRLANEVITWELKRIEAINALGKKLGDLRKLIPVYKGRCPANKNVLTNQIINLELQLIAAKSNQPAPHPSAPLPPAQLPHISHQNSVQPIQSNDMDGNYTGRPQQIPNLYWQQGHPGGAPVRTFRQIKYLPLFNALPDLDQALSGARLDCGNDIHKQLIEYGGAAKVWITIQVEYDPVNPLADKQPFEQFLSAAPTRIFRRDGPITAFTNPYIDSLRILTDRIREFNAKFIRDKFGSRLARVLQITLKMAKYAPL